MLHVHVHVHVLKLRPPLRCVAQPPRWSAKPELTQRWFIEPALCSERRGEELIVVHGALVSHIHHSEESLDLCTARGWGGWTEANA